MTKIKLSEICDLQNGYAFKSTDYVEVSNTLSCRMSNIRLGGIFDIDYNSRYLPDSFSDKFKSFLIKDGDLVIAMTDLANDPKLLGVPTLVKTGGKNILLNQRVGKLIIKDSSAVDNRYLQYVLNDPKTRKYYKKFAGGGLQINLGKNDLLNVEIFLPPLEEQRRIASILDKADAIRQKRQQAITKLDELLQATFIDMFGDESNDYKGIDKVNLLEKVDFLTGFAFKSNDFKSSGIKLCRGINVLTGYLDWNSTAYWDSSEHDKFKKFELKKDDIVIAMDRPWISSGFKISMIGEEDKDILLVQRVARLRSKESSYSNFIYHLLDSHNFKNHCNVTETTIPHISPTDFKTFLIPDAPQSQILKFDKFAKAVRAQKQAMKISLEKSNDFFNSLQQKAFNGTL